MDVTLDPGTEKLVQKEIESGRFRNPNDLIGVALKHFLIARELGEEYTQQEIEEKISRGLHQLERREDVDGDEFFEKLRLRAEELRHQRG
jgi:Arc/MetJ-type ribon-helix-helix transcriptional regulator